MAKQIVGIGDDLSIPLKWGPLILAVDMIIAGLYEGGASGACFAVESVVDQEALLRAAGARVIANIFDVERMASHDPVRPTSYLARLMATWSDPLKSAATSDRRVGFLRPCGTGPRSARGVAIGVGPRRGSASSA